MDMREKPHRSDLIIEKWRGLRTEQLEVHFTGDLSVEIASCCMEFATLDRVLYNLVNNAIRHGEGSAVEMYMLPDQAAKPEHLFLGVKNKMSDTGKAGLMERFGSNWSELFRSGYTTGGSGFELSICADCVSRAYQVHTFEALVAGRYLGAEARGDAFLAWVFWPLMSAG